jgi:hypothetical protein
MDRSPAVGGLSLQGTQAAARTAVRAKKDKISEKVIATAKSDDYYNSFDCLD